MMTALHQLRLHFSTRGRSAEFGRLFFLTLLAALTVFTGSAAVSEWRAYQSAYPVRAKLVDIEMDWSQPQPRPGVYVFDTGRASMLFEEERSSLVKWSMKGLLADKYELQRLQVGDATTLWVFPEEGITTPSLRAPIAMTVVPILFLLLLLPSLQSTGKSRPVRQVERYLAMGRFVLPGGALEESLRHSDGRAEVQLRYRNRVKSVLALVILVTVMMIAMVFLPAGILAAVLGSELLLRYALAQASILLVYIPFLLPVGLLSKPSRVTWNESTLWVNGNPIDRVKLERVAIVPGESFATLQMREQGIKSFTWVRCDALWVASILDRLGIPIEFSEKGI